MPRAGKSTRDPGVKPSVLGQIGLFVKGDPWGTEAGGIRAGDRVRLLTAVGGLLDCVYGSRVGRLGRRLLEAAGSRLPLGWVAERLNAPVLKTGNGESRSWVQIPPHPFFWNGLLSGACWLLWGSSERHESRRPIWPAVMQVG